MYISLITAPFSHFSFWTLFDRTKTVNKKQLLQAGLVRVHVFTCASVVFTCCTHSPIKFMIECPLSGWSQFCHIVLMQFHLTVFADDVWEAHMHAHELSKVKKPSTTRRQFCNQAFYCASRVFPWLRMHLYGNPVRFLSPCKLSDVTLYI